MSLLNSASLCVTPNAYKEGTLYSVIPNTTLGDMTVVRATTATRVNSAGLIELVPYNLLQYSEQFNNAAWSTQDATITANSTTAPNGTLTADTFTRTANTAFLYATNAFSLITGSYSISVYAKANATSSFRLDLGSSGLSQGVTCTFNLSTATAGTPILYGSASSFVATIENVGNGWYRCSLSGNLISANYYAELAITTTGSIYIWGAQLNDGSLKDYLRTETRLNIPRLDYSNGTCPSLLVEPQRSNLALYSEQFDNASWVTTNITTAANSVTSPSGIQSADTITSTTTSGNHLIGTNSISITNGTNYSFTFFAKKGSGRYIQILGGGGGFALTSYANFDLQLGTVSFQGATATAEITSFNDNWYRCKLTAPAIDTLSDRFYISIITTATASRAEVHSTALSYYCWGAQFEQGSYPTSYIPTTSAAVTRNADVISKTGISSLIGQTEGTIFADAVLTGKDSTNGSILFATDKVSTGAIIRVFYTSANALRFDVFNGSSFQCLISAGAYNVGDRVKVAGAYKNNDFVMYVNGTQIGTDTSGTVPATDTANINTSIYGDTNGSRINSAILFPTRLTNAELASLTTI